MYDLIIVGGRIAGATTAMLAAREGLKTLFIDRHDFPSDTLSTSYIHQSGCALLKRWGLLNKIAESGCPPITETKIRCDEVTILGTVSKDQEQREAYAPRRYILDKIIIDAAVAAGAEFRSKCRLESVETVDGKVRCVSLKTSAGTVMTEQCKVLIGADGMRSSVAQMLEIPFFRKDPTLTCVYYGFWDGLDQCYQLYEGYQRWLGVIPTNHSTLVVTYFPQSEFHRIRKSPLTFYTEAVKTLAPEVAAKMQSARRIGKLWGTGDQWNYFRKANGKNWALVGDAAIHKDSLTALGITDALTHAETLIKLLSPCLKSNGDLKVVLEEYSRAIIASTTPGYEDTLSLANPQERVNRKRLLKALLGKPQCIETYFDALGGLCEPEKLFAALNS